MTGLGRVEIAADEASSSTWLRRAFWYAPRRLALEFGGTAPHNPLL